MTLNISVITSAAKRSRSGNRTTAVRWARILESLGHSTTIDEAWPGAVQPETTDILIAIHAWRSAASVAAFRARHPSRPLVVLMSGTDIYRFQHSHAKETIASIAAADRLVGLHDAVADDLPPRFRSKLRVIHQSALPLPAPRNPSRRSFDVCVIGHLRDEKDPFRAAYAARSVPDASRLRIIHLGKPHDAAYGRKARIEMAANPRYVWRGEVPRWQVRRTLARTPRDGDELDHGGRCERGLGSRGGRRAGHRFRDPRKRRVARARPSRFVSSRRHQSSVRVAPSSRDRFRISQSGARARRRAMRSVYARARAFGLGRAARRALGSLTRTAIKRTDSPEDSPTIERVGRGIRFAPQADSVIGSRASLRAMTRPMRAV